MRPPATRARPPRLAPLAMGLLLAASLAAAVAVKAPCVDGTQGVEAMTNYCYSDVTELWARHRLDVDAWVYAQPRPAGADGAFEYPPGTGLPVFLIARLTRTLAGYFWLTAATLVIAALITAWQLDATLRALERPRLRLLGFALSPTLILLGLQNWDLWALALVAGGIHAAVRERPALAGAAFGLGAAVKWWPALLVVALLWGPWAPRDRRLIPPLAAAGAWLAVQLPVVLHSPRGWWATTAFHLRRPPNPDSVVAALERLIGPSGALRVVTLVLLVAATAAVAWLLRRGRVGAAEGALLLVVTFLLTSKVSSPQFVLWLLPLAVVARVPWTPVLAVESANLFTWFAIALYYPTVPKVDGLLTAAQVGSVVRWACLVWLAVELLQVPSRGPAPAGNGGARDNGGTAAA